MAWLKNALLNRKKYKALSWWGKLHGWSCKVRACDYLWRKRHALGSEHQNQTVGVYLLPSPTALLWQMVAYLFLLLTKRNTKGGNIHCT